MIQKWTFIGGGQMARAMAGGWFQTGVVSPEATTVVEINADAVALWGSENPEVQIATLDLALKSADAVVLAVKPNVVAEVLSQGDYAGKLVVSIAAGISLASLQEGARHGRVVRVMPNTPALVGQAACGYACGKDVSDSDRKTIQCVLDAIGLAVEVDEKQMDAVTGLSGSGPAYVCLVIEALADGGVAAGLPREMAMRLATQTVLGTATMIQETGRHPAQLKDAVASPGGTTIAGLASLEADGLRSALINAVLAATQRSRELGKKE
jgi:pyrroline-5-carboxylate reductase